MLPSGCVDRMPRQTADTAVVVQPSCWRWAILPLTVAACLVEAVALADGPVRLPQDHEYQVILRNYIGSLTEKDFALKLEPVEFRERWVRDDETLHRLWVLGQSFPDPNGLVLAPENFLLRTIESPEGIRIRVGEAGEPKDPEAGVYPEDTSWWSTWNWRGNPYFDSRAVRNRAFVVAAVDMIMLDKLHESGSDWVKNARRSDFLGGTLSWLAHVYRDTRRDLPEQVRAAFETGLEKFVDRLTEWGPTCVNENMDMKSLVAAAYIAEALREGPIVDKARAYAKRVLPLIHPAGMVRDAGGLEASYNGIAEYSLAWATSVKPWPEYVAALRSMSDLKGHLTLPEPDGLNFWGPSHFSTRTGSDSPNDQWAFPPRDIAMAMHADDAVYLMFGGRRDRRPGWAVPRRADMATGIKAAVDHVTRSLKPSAKSFKVWQANWWTSGKFNYAYDHYPRGFYGLLTRLQTEKHPVTLPPLVRPDETYIYEYPPADMPDVADVDRKAFAVARFPNYTAIVYTGPIGWHSYMNFAGGGLSAFWTRASGAVVLGRIGSPVDPKKTKQSWEDWRLWPTHAVSGQTASGGAFSSARLRREMSTVDYQVGRQTATVRISGPIGKQHDESRAAQDGCIVGTVRYSRSLGLGPDGVVVETRIDSDGKDSVTELCEVIPLFLRDEKLQVPTPEQPALGVPHRVLFQVDGKLMAPPEDFVDGVTAVVVDRFLGGMAIRFDQPKRVRLGNTWIDSYQTSVCVRNLLIDLLEGQSGPVDLPSVSIRYFLQPHVPQPATPAGR
jgi:hypothetical protein